MSGQFSASVLPGPVWQVQAPALAPAAAINHWEMNWGCPVPGSEVAAVLFGALRTAPASSMEIRVTGDRRVLWSEGDVAMPQSPAGGRGYDVRLPGGQCNVHLALSQVEQRAQHARVYFIDNPRILVRDVAAPSVAVREVSSGWLNGSAPLGVVWATSDNFGDDGLGQQRVVVGGRVLWAGAPGQGEHAVVAAARRPRRRRPSASRSRPTATGPGAPRRPPRSRSIARRRRPATCPPPRWRRRAASASPGGRPTT